MIIESQNRNTGYEQPQSMAVCVLTAGGPPQRRRHFLSLSGKRGRIQSKRKAAQNLKNFTHQGWESEKRAIVIAYKREKDGAFLRFRAKSLKEPFKEEKFEAPQKEQNPVLRN